MSTLMVQGTSSGAGKTVLVAALCRIFSDMGYRVAPFKSQNMSRYSLTIDDFEIAVAQAVQAAAARCEITPHSNPILLKPLGDYYSHVYLDGHPYKRMHASDYYETFVNTTGLETSLKSLRYLMREYDIVILEGAGSPAEINMTRYDIANMRMAAYAGSPVLLVADIERGGAFASIAGTISLLDEEYRGMIKGLVFNKFRGDVNILRPGFGMLEEITGKRVLGAIPYLDITLPEEDSLGLHTGAPMDKLPDMEAELDDVARAVGDAIGIEAIKGLISC